MKQELKEKYLSFSLPARAAIWFTICNFILRGISFITGPIFTRLLPSNEYGKYAIFLSYEQIILIFATWEIQLGAYQKGIFKYKNDIQGYTSSTQFLVNIITLLCFSLLFVYRKVFLKVTGLEFKVMFLMFIYLLFRPAYDCWLTRKRKAYEYKIAVFITILYSIANVIIPMGAILFLNRTANVKIVTTLICSSLFCFVFYLRNANYFDAVKNQNIIDYWKYNIAFEGPLVLHSLSYLILSQADRVMINNIVGSSEAAFYSVSYSVASVVGLFQISINQSLTPWRYQMLEDKKYSSIKKVTNGLLIMMGILIIAFILVVPEGMKILFTKEYYDAVWCIPPISVSVFFMFLYSIYVNIEEYYEKTNYVVIVSVTCGLVNVLLNYICIHKFGYIACAYTTLFSYILFAVGHHFFMTKTLQDVGMKEKIIDSKIVCLVSFLIVILSVIVTFLYDYAFIRYCLFTFIIVFGFLQRHKVKELYVKMKKKEV